MHWKRHFQIHYTSSSRWYIPFHGSAAFQDLSSRVSTIQVWQKTKTYSFTYTSNYTFNSIVDFTHTSTSTTSSYTNTCSSYTFTTTFIKTSTTQTQYFSQPPSPTPSPTLLTLEIRPPAVTPARTGTTTTNGTFIITTRTLLPTCMGTHTNWTGIRAISEAILHLIARSLAISQ